MSKKDNLSSESLRKQIKAGLEKQKISDISKSVPGVTPAPEEDEIKIDTVLQDNPYEGMKIEDIASGYMSDDELKYLDEGGSDDSLDVISETSEFVREEPSNHTRVFDKEDEADVDTENDYDSDEVIPSDYDMIAGETDYDDGESLVDDGEILKGEKAAEKKGLFARLKEFLIRDKDDSESDEETEEGSEDFEYQVDEDEKAEGEAELADESATKVIDAASADGEGEIDDTDVKLMMAFDMNEELENTATM